MQVFSDWLSKEFSTKVYNIEIGNGEKTSMYSPMTIQLNELCSTIYGIPELKFGFNFIGMSQGGLLARGYIERCNNFPVNNLITLVSPHGGVFFKNEKINMYSDFSQDHLSFSGYWRDPLLLETYLHKCRYLPILNNEQLIETNISKTQSKNIKSLNNFVMIWSPNDDVIEPPESGKFSFYDKKLNIVEIEDTLIYDTLGLKFLNDKNGFHKYKTNCTHVQHRDPVCFSQLYPIIKPYLV
jgi:palmitoyl-protein thioesterase